jgi:hypothetical protein
MANSTGHLRIPIRLVNGIWESALGDTIPVSDGTQAELGVDREFVFDAARREHWEEGIS